MFVIEFGFIDQRLDIFVSDLNITKKKQQQKTIHFHDIQIPKYIKEGGGEGRRLLFHLFAQCCLHSISFQGNHCKPEQISTVVSKINF